MRNLNVQISDDLVPRMEELKKFNKVNWSAIVRECIRQYLKQRNGSSIDQNIKGKSEDFKLGFNFIIESVDLLDLKTIEDIAYGKIEDKYNRNEEFNDGMSKAAKELLIRSE